MRINKAIHWPVVRYVLIVINKMITHYFVKCLVELLCVTLQINEQTNPY